MTHKFDGYNYLLRFDKDELLIAALTDFVKKQGIKAAWVSGLGGAQWAELGFYDLPATTYRWQRFDELLEVTALQGNIAWKDSEPALHLHGTLTNSQFQAIGGHVKELAVAGTCELFLHTIFGDEKLTRSANETTGLSLLDL